MEEQLADAEPVPPEEPVGAGAAEDGLAAERGEEDPGVSPGGRVLEVCQERPELPVGRVPRRRAPLQERRRRRRGRWLHSGGGHASHGFELDRWEEEEAAAAERELAIAKSSPASPTR